jgi:hypothetical protein
VRVLRRPVHDPHARRDRDGGARRRQDGARPEERCDPWPVADLGRPLDPEVLLHVADADFVQAVRGHLGPAIGLARRAAAVVDRPALSGRLHHHDDALVSVRQRAERDHGVKEQDSDEALTAPPGTNGEQGHGSPHGNARAMGGWASIARGGARRAQREHPPLCLRGADVAAAVHQPAVGAGSAPLLMEDGGRPVVRQVRAPAGGGCLRHER